uniref:Uncharacterized protein n=1 Tax=Anguilla anguilla TaxID=7936 RepID=A0A0E9PZ09_ANGAN
MGRRLPAHSSPCVGICRRQGDNPLNRHSLLVRETMSRHVSVTSVDKNGLHGFM